MKMTAFSPLSHFRFEDSPVNMGQPDWRACGFISGRAVICLLLAFSASAVGVSTIDVEDTDLVQLQLVWRHGNRTRVKMDTYANDPYKDTPDFEGVGNLNERGKARAHLLGISLRQRYGQFLGDDYLPTIHKIQSTDARRAIDSAMLVMPGLFPPSKNMAWTSTGQTTLGYLWQPFDIVFEASDKDNLLGNSHVDCPAIGQERARIRTSEEVFEDDYRMSNNGSIFEYLTFHAGELVNDSFITQGIHNALLCQEDQGWPLPQWTNSVYPEPLRTLCGLGLGQFGRTKLIQRLIIGPLLDTMISSAERAVGGNTSHSEPRLLAFSGHDTNIVALLAAMGLPNESNTVPYYSAHIAWEIRKSKSDNTAYVRALYEGEQLYLPGCDFQPLCPLPKMKELLSDVTVTREQHWKECAS